MLQSQLWRQEVATYSISPVVKCPFRKVERNPTLDRKEHQRIKRDYYKDCLKTRYLYSYKTESFPMFLVDSPQRSGTTPAECTEGFSYHKRCGLSRGTPARRLTANATERLPEEHSPPTFVAPHRMTALQRLLCLETKIWREKCHKS